MKKIIKEETRVIKREIFVAADGREFINEEDCKKWEKSYECTLRKSFEQLNIKKLSQNDIGDIGIPFAQLEDNCYLVKARNTEEVVLINAYIKMEAYSDNLVLTTDIIDKIIILNFGYEYGWCDCYILEEVLKTVTKNITKQIEEFNKVEE